MFRFAPYLLKTLWRHRTRTALTVSGSAVALFVFSFIGAVQGGLDRLTKDSSAERSLIVFQQNRFCPATSRLPEDYGRQMAKIPGVDDTLPIKVFTNNCRASLDVVVFHGMPPEKLKSFRNLKLVAGDWKEFEGRRDAALVGQAVATRRNLGVGQKFTIGEVSVTVAGIFKAESINDENIIYSHLVFLQQTRGLNSMGTVTQFEVRLQESADAEGTAKAIDAHFKSAPVQTDSRPKGVFQANTVGDLVELIGFAHYLGYACVGMVLALVATTTVMAVQDRVREYAVLQTLGFTYVRIFQFVLVESIIVSFGGGIVGIGAAMGVLGFSGLAMGTEGVTIAFTPSLGLAVTGLVVSMGVGLLAGFVPAWQAARAEIVTSLRFV